MKNTLVQYQGGGYSGCFWEWNYLFLDKDGRFHNIQSSGQNGIETTEQMNVLFNDMINVSGNKWTNTSCDTFYAYDLTNNEDIEEFNRESNVAHAVGVLQWFTDNPQEGIEFYVICSDCGERTTDYSECYLEQWHGCGGIMSTADKVICQKCHAYGTCQCCEEYVGKDDVVYLKGPTEYDDDITTGYSRKAERELIDDGYSDVCKWCLDYQTGQIEKQEHEDLRFKSFATGKPDIFSNDMRWYWKGY